MSRKKKPSKPFQLEDIEFLNDNQYNAMTSYMEGENLILHGYPGTGKTFLALWLALDEVLEGEGPKHITVVRSAVPSRDMGFMPGTEKEKSMLYEMPYRTICNELFDRGDGYELLKQRKLIEFTTTSYLRGINICDTVVIVDEIQNMSFQELDTIMTRLGQGSRVIFCGDYRQSDLQKENEMQGVHKFMKIIKKISDFTHIEFSKEDIVRSGLVKEYIITKTEMEK